MNLFQISAGSEEQGPSTSKGSYFLPFFTIRWWTKWHFSHRLQLMCPSNCIPLCRRYIAEKQMSLSLFTWRYRTSSVSIMIWSNPLPDALTISYLGNTARFYITLFLMRFLPSHSLWNPSTANETVLGTPRCMVFFCLLDSVALLFFFGHLQYVQHKTLML